MTIGDPNETDAIMVGMHRPPLSKFTDFAGVVICGSEHECWTTQQVAACWREGHFDRPIHVSLQELIAAGWQPKEPK